MSNETKMDNRKYKEIQVQILYSNIHFEVFQMFHIFGDYRKTRSIFLYQCIIVYHRINLKDKVTMYSKT